MWYYADEETSVLDKIINIKRSFFDIDGKLQVHNLYNYYTIRKELIFTDKRFIKSKDTNAEWT